MQIRNAFMAASVMAVGLAGAMVTASTTTVVSNGVSLTHPNFPTNGPALVSCEPWETEEGRSILLSGIPEGARVVVSFGWSAPPPSATLNYQPQVIYNNVIGGSLEVPVNYPTDTNLWPLVDPDTNERAIAVYAMAGIVHDGVVLAKFNVRWWVKCKALQRPNEGCTPGYWRQPHHEDSWVGYAPADSFGTVFGVTPGFSPNSLGDAVWANGGGENALARHSVAALLNASSADVNYPYTIAQVLSMVQAAYATGSFEATKNAFEVANEAGCPLN